MMDQFYKYQHEVEMGIEPKEMISKFKAEFERLGGESSDAAEYIDKKLEEYTKHYEMYN